MGAAVGDGVGAKVGLGLGENVGAGDGVRVGAAVGAGDGAGVGAGVGDAVGAAVGDALGFADGAGVGAVVGMIAHHICPVWPAVHIVALQSWHMWYLILSWYLPDGQWKQFVWPVHALYLPAAHEWHVLPVVGW